MTRHNLFVINIIYLKLIYFAFCFSSQESTAVAMNGLYEMFYKPPVRIGMVGPVLSFITVEIAAVTGLWDFVQVSLK